MLNNSATALGNYNSVPTTLMSDEVNVTMVSGLTITKTADKSSWADGPLTYTITISNQAIESYTSPVITDVIDTSLVDFMDDSVTINGVATTSTQYNYNNETSTLTVNLQDITSTSEAVVTFKVTKK